MGVTACVRLAHVIITLVLNWQLPRGQPRVIASTHFTRKSLLLLGAKSTADM